MKIVVIKWENLLQAIFVDLQPDPIKLLNILKIVRSPSQQDLGPWFYVDARKTPIFIEVSVKSTVGLKNGSKFVIRVHCLETRQEHYLR